MALEAGQTINNRYRIVKLLGRGGFGAVYRAWDANLRKPCALKENLEISSEAQRQFNREATVLANLSHPNLPRVTDYFTIEDQGQYLVMDYVEGEDLASLVQHQGAMNFEQATVWIAQVADALSYLHQRIPPVVHRDIKPANIRITPDGKAMLVDFGLVKLFDPQMKTTIGARAVTPGFAPPEQYGQGSTDPRTDIYALGATLYNIITNQHPMESIRRMVGGKMKTAHQVNPEIPETLSLIIEQAMDLEPSQRFQNAQEFRSALQGKIKLPTPVHIPAPVESTVMVAPGKDLQSSPVFQPSVAAAGSVPIARAEAPPTGRFAMGMGMGVMIVLVICILGAAAVGYWAFNSQAGSATETASAEIQKTLDDRVRLTSTAQEALKANINSTEQARITVAARVAATATAEAGVMITAQALDGFIQNILNSRTVVIGPVDGSIPHNAEDTLISVYQEPADLRDFVVEVNIFNPYPATTGNWDYGFLFRHEENNRHYRLVIRSDQKWVLLNNTGDPDGVILQDGDLPGLNTEKGGSNFIRLICQGTQGFFYLNDALVAVLDLSARTNSGGILIATGLYLGNEITGYSTDFTQFTIWSIP